MTTQNEVQSQRHGPRWCCIPCEVEWRGEPSCFTCSGLGVRWEGNGPDGWPKTVVTAGMAR